MEKNGLVMEMIMNCAICDKEMVHPRKDLEVLRAQKTICDECKAELSETNELEENIPVVVEDKKTDNEPEGINEVR